jgi:sodium--glutamate symport carrier gltS
MATFGLIMGSLMGGPIAHKLINRDHLEADKTSKAVGSANEEATVLLDSERTMLGVAEIMLCMGIGTIVTHFFRFYAYCFSRIHRRYVGSRRWYAIFLMLQVNLMSPAQK